MAWASRAAILAGVGQRSASAAAEVEAVLVEDPRGGRVGDSNFSECSRVVHDGLGHRWCISYAGQLAR
jgi:hypothetical protein